MHSFGNIHQHLDLIAGLPYEDYDTFHRSFNDVYRMKPDQLQLGFLKVLKGSLMEKEAEKFFKGFCEIVKKEPLLDLLGHGVVGYSSTGEQLARISLDPFEISAMNVALGRNKLKEYILATNGYDEYAYQQLLKEYKIRHENK